MAYVIGFTGLSNSGKTTLITKVTQILCSKGLRVGVIKHDAHGHYKEAKNTDSARYMDSGAKTVVLSGKVQVVRFDIPLVEPTIEELVAEMPELDMIIIEGYKTSVFPKIAVFRVAEQTAILNKLQGGLIAIVSAIPYTHWNKNIPIYGIDDSMGVAELLCKEMKRSV